MVTFRALLVAALMLGIGGCADDAASAYLPGKPSHTSPVREGADHAPIARSPALGVQIDLPAIVHDANLIPLQLSDLRRTIIWAVFSLGIVGLANAGFIVLLGARIPRAPSALEIDAEGTIPQPVARALAALVDDLHVAPNPYGHLVAPLSCAGVQLAYAAIPRQPGPARAGIPRGERRRCACGQPVAARARARRCETCLAAANAKRRDPELAS